MPLGGLVLLLVVASSHAACGLVLLLVVSLVARVLVACSLRCLFVFWFVCMLVSLLFDCVLACL